MIGRFIQNTTIGANSHNNRIMPPVIRKGITSFFIMNGNIEITIINTNTNSTEINIFCQATLRRFLIFNNRAVLAAVVHCNKFL